MRVARVVLALLVLLVLVLWLVVDSSSGSRGSSLFLVADEARRIMILKTSLLSSLWTHIFQPFIIHSDDAQRSIAT